jgi:hypothetical protein
MTAGALAPYSDYHCTLPSGQARMMRKSSVGLGSDISRTISPIRVSHQLELQIYYSIEGELASGAPCDGPGELRMMSTKTGIMVPSCCCTISSLDLPPCKSSTASSNDCCGHSVGGANVTDTRCDDEGLKEFDQLFQTPAELLGCMCGCTFEELSQPLQARLNSGDGLVASGGEGENVSPRK